MKDLFVPEFSGVASRGQFWSFLLRSILFVLSVAPLALFCALLVPKSGLGIGVMLTISALAIGYFVGILLNTVSWMGLYCRRLRDLGHSPWWSLTAFLPLVSLFTFCYLAFGKGGMATSRPDAGQVVGRN